MEKKNTEKKNQHDSSHKIRLYSMWICACVCESNDAVKAALSTRCSHTYMYIHTCNREHVTSICCQPPVRPGYLTWPSRANAMCQRQCSCCNLGQAIYKESSQVQAQGARGRQRDGRIKEYLQGRETKLQGIGEKEQKEQRRPERQCGAEWIKVVGR